MTLPSSRAETDAGRRPGEPARILVVEDKDSLRRMLTRALSGEGHAVVAEEGVAGAVRQLAGGAPFDLVLTDLRLGEASGLEVVAEASACRPPVPTVVMTAYGTVGTAVEAMKSGALDFLEKPVELDDLFELVDRVVGTVACGEGFEAPGAPMIVGSHPRIAAALHLLRRVAPTDSTVLLTGESGTGKELFARALHGVSRRQPGPFVAVNCAAIPEALVENELFGHEKGAFTGADRRQAGRFEAADRGTLFLDEIGELTPPVQAKILRVLEERRFERVGGGSPVTVDVRLVAATNRNLEQMVEAGTFRADLFFRLDVFPIELPPLRDRRADIEPLATHLLGQIADRHGRRPPSLTPAAVAALLERDWPGNVRQLANVLERAVILADGNRLDLRDLESLLPAVPADEGAGDERERCRLALVEARGDKRRAAALLGMSYRSLQRRVRELDLEGVPDYRSGLPGD